MPSPFPGMNPWIERASVWQDFHHSILPAMREALNRQFAPRYLARVQEYISIDEADGESIAIGKPNVPARRSRNQSSRHTPVCRPPNRDAPHGAAQVSQRTAQRTVPATFPDLVDFSNSVGTLAASVRVRQVDPQVEREIFLEVRDREERRLITAIELLSPANKRTGPIRKQYLRKREALLESDAHFIEIDLLRGGPRMPWRGLPPCDYYALVSRVELRPEAEFWPIRLRDPLPTIPVPLKPGDADARLDLQALLHRVYDDGAYAADIYSGTPEPPLSSEDDAWSRSLTGQVQ